MSNGVLARLRSLVPHLTPVLRRIGSYALENPEKVIYHTVTELAEASSSSEGSVIRFCQELGFSGLQDFKLALAVDLASSVAPTDLLVVPDNTQELTRHVIRTTVSSIEETGRLLDASAVDDAVKHILNARRIDIYGVGASGTTASYLDYKLLRLGLPSKAYVDPHLATMSASQLDQSCVAIGISSSGSTRDIIDAVDTAHSVGAYIVAIVNRLKSPLAKKADCVLLASSHESPLTGGAVLSKMSQLLVLEVLFTAMVRCDERLQERIRATAEAVVDKSL